jgi:hypothetical protein
MITLYETVLSSQEKPQNQQDRLVKNMYDITKMEVVSWDLKEVDFSKYFKINELIKYVAKIYQEKHIVSLTSVIDELTYLQALLNITPYINFPQKYMTSLKMCLRKGMGITLKENNLIPQEDNRNKIQLLYSITDKYGKEELTIEIEVKKK